MGMDVSLQIYNQCGVRDLSWSELRHFFGFLDTQLRNCENSISVMKI